MTASVESQSITEHFSARFGGQPRLFHAPGRVNLIGEHTDYNGGMVLPMAIGFGVTVAAAPREGRMLRVHSEAFGETAELDLTARPAQKRGAWSDYVHGVAVALGDDGIALGGADLLVRSTVPVGAGLSSSAALEVAVGYTLMRLAGADIDRRRLAGQCQRAENEFVGLRCGIMDQLASACGRADHALLIACDTLEMRLVPLPSDVAFVIVNSMVKHSLAASAYNERRAECEARVPKRWGHVVSENQRVLDAATALEQGDSVRFGELMSASHTSLRDEFEVSCAELDALVAIANTAGALGSRMTGGGFGGCTVSLVQAATADTFIARVREHYARITGKTADAWVCQANDGASEITPQYVRV